MPDARWTTPRDVLIIGDHELVRLGLSALLAQPQANVQPPPGLQLRVLRRFFDRAARRSIGMNADRQCNSI